MKPRPRRLGWVVATAVCGVLTVVAACSDQGEGERCDRLNGNNDCQEGLVCTPAAQLPTNSGTGDRCCPADRRNATSEYCAPVSASAGDAQPPADTGPDAETPDAPADTSTPDTSTDAADAADAGDAADADDSG